MILIVKNKPIATVTLATNEIQHFMSFGEFYIGFTVYDKYNKIRPLVASNGDKLIIDNKTFTVPYMPNDKRLSEFIDSITIPIHNEYMEHLLENM